MKVNHLALYVKDLEAAKGFFEKYFTPASCAAYHNPRTGFRSWLLRFEGGTGLEIMTKPDMDDSAKPLNRTDFAHVSFSAGSKGNVDALTGRLRADGFRVIDGPRTTGDGYYESCVAGPEGNQVEITV